jgi:hypothetical protein
LVVSGDEPALPRIADGQSVEIISSFVTLNAPEESLDWPLDAADPE